MPPSRQLTRTRELRAWALKCEGWSETRIAAELGVTQPAVSQMLARVEQRVLEGMQDIVERVKLEQNARLEHVISEALTAWEGSKKPSTHTTIRDIVDGQQLQKGQQGQLMDRTTSINQSGPNTSYLRIVLDALAAQREVWGIDQTTDAGGNMGGGQGPMLPPLRQVILNLPPGTPSLGSSDDAGD